MARVMVELQNCLGQRVRYVSRGEAERLVSRGVAFYLAPRRLRLADRRDVGSGIDRGTKATITRSQIERAAEGRFDRGADDVSGYHARRIAAWPGIHDRLAPLAG